LLQDKYKENTAFGSSCDGYQNQQGLRSATGYKNCAKVTPIKQLNLMLFSNSKVECTCVGAIKMFAIQNG
jgi:hypothetical protein